jgi:hypothetical protein
MPTYTPNYNFTLPLVNSVTDQDLWGSEVNANFTSLDTIIKSIGNYYFSSVIQGNAVNLTSGIPKNITFIDLPIGNWDVDGIVSSFLAGTTQEQLLAGSISLASNSLNLASEGGRFTIKGFELNGVATTASTGIRRISLVAPTTVYLVAQSNFTFSTNSAFGIIQARQATAV